MSGELDARLAGLHIERVAGAKGYTLYARGPCMAMVSESSVGSTGYMTDTGLGYLFWRGGRPWLKSKIRESAATPEQVEAIEKFSEDLKKALAPPVINS